MTFEVSCTKKTSSCKRTRFNSLVVPPVTCILTVVWYSYNCYCTVQNFKRFYMCSFNGGMPSVPTSFQAVCVGLELVRICNSEVIFDKLLLVPGSHPLRLAATLKAIYCLRQRLLISVHYYKSRIWEMSIPYFTQNSLK